MVLDVMQIPPLAALGRDDRERPGRDDRERAVGMTAESLFSRLGLDDGLRRSETCDRNAERRA